MITQKEMILDFIKSKDFIPKIACLVLAVILWSYIGNRNDNELRYKIKIEVINLKEDQVVTDMQKRYVAVRIRGEAEDLENIDRKQMRATVDLSDTIIGKPYRYDLNLVYEDMPEAVDISLNDKKIFITVDRKVSRNLFVRPDMSGKVASGYILGNITVEPERVVIYGSSDMIQSISSIKTENFSISGITSTMITEVPLDTARFEFSNISTNTVTVRAEVFPADDVYIYEPELEVYGLMENFSYDISLSSCKVYVQTQTGEKPKINPNDVKLWADLDPVYGSDFINESGRKVAEIRRKVSVKAMINQSSEDVQIISVVPDSVIVKIQQ